MSLKDQNLNPKRVYLAIGRLPNGDEVSSYASNPETAQRLLENSGCPKKVEIVAILCYKFKGLVPLKG